MAAALNPLSVLSGSSRTMAASRLLPPCFNVTRCVTRLPYRSRRAMCKPYRINKKRKREKRNEKWECGSRIGDPLWLFSVLFYLISAGKGGISRAKETVLEEKKCATGCKRLRLRDYGYRRWWPPVHFKCVVVT